MTEGSVDGLKTDYNLKEVFRQTYYISQGDAGLQRSLYEWLKLENIFKLSDFPSETPDWINNFYAPGLHSVKGQKISEKNDSKVEWAYFRYTISEKVNIQDKEKLLNKILLDIIKRDLDYQLTERPGRIINKSTKPDDAQDVHKSFVRHYILNDNFYSKPFSDLFSILKPLLHAIEQASPQELERVAVPKPEENEDSKRNWVRNSLNLKQKLGMLAKLWEQNHPGEKFFK